MKQSLAAALCGLILAAGCTALRDLARIRRPDVCVSGMKLIGLDFHSADLALTFQISNPNSVGVTVAGYDYQLKLNGLAFLEGDETGPVTVPANGTGRIDLPVSLSYAKMYDTIRSLSNRDSTDYEITAGFRFDLPVLGPVRVPVRTQGRLPLMKFPEVTVRRLSVDRIGLTGADLELVLDVRNPNSMPLTLKAMRYDLTVNQSVWATGKILEAVSLEKNGEGAVTIPVSLDFLKMGRSVARLLQSGSKLDYSLTGDMDVGSDLDVFRDDRLPVDKEGKTDLFE